MNTSQQSDPDRVSIRHAVNQAVQALSSSPTARLDAEVLLVHLLGKNRTYLRAWPDAALSTEVRQAYAALISSRRQGVPVAYLTGRKEFWSREFIVSPDVLIPRPETELLIEWALQRTAGLKRPQLLDLATGSGIIAVTLAAEIRDAVVYGSDLSEAALAIARRNAELHAAGRIRFLHSAWFDRFPPHLHFDLIVSNPPYVAETDPHLGEGDVRYEPALALRAGPDGFDAYRLIAERARDRLVPGGWLLLEHGCEQAAELRTLLEDCGYRGVTHREDLQGHPRATGAEWPGS